MFKYLKCLFFGHIYEPTERMTLANGEIVFVRTCSRCGGKSFSHKFWVGRK